MTWAQERRLDFIDDRLFTTGEINRADLAAYFDLTVQQASADFGRFADLDPHFTYNLSQKRYERKGGGSIRNSTPERRAAWEAFPPILALADRSAT